MCADSSGAACCGSCESMTIVRAIMAVLKMMMLKAMEGGMYVQICKADFFASQKWFAHTRKLRTSCGVREIFASSFERPQQQKP